MKRRATSMLFAVATSTAAVAAADPAPTPPLTLPSGAPACGNVGNKYMPQPPVCAKARLILTAITEELEQIRQVFALFSEPEKPSLTLGKEIRPRS
jgi:hypothetical protein